MKGFAKKLEDLFAAVAFAEAGEFETARQVMGSKGQVTVPSAGCGKGSVAAAMPATKS